MKSNALTLTIGTVAFLLVIYVVATLLIVQNPTMSLCMWDAKHYEAIRHTGYTQGYAAFFPLLPSIWSLLDLNIWGMSLLNIVFFSVGIYFLLKTTLTHSPYILAWAISLSHFFFFMVPYTESLCFLGLSLFLYFNKNEKWLWACLTLCAIALVRPLFTTLLCTFVGHIVWNILKRENSASLRYLAYLGVVAGITCLFFLYLKEVRGDFWAFFEAQKKWNHEVRSLELPLKLSNWYVGIFEVLGLAVGIWCIYVVCARFFDFKTQTNHMELDIYAYLACMTCTMLAIQGGSLFSSNRYILCSPFFFYIVCKSAELTSVKNSLKAFVGAVVLVLLLCWQKFPEHLVFIALVLLLNIAAYYFYTFKGKKIVMLLAIVVNMLFQLVLFYNYLKNNWVA